MASEVLARLHAKSRREWLTGAEWGLLRGLLGATRQGAPAARSRVAPAAPQTAADGSLDRLAAMRRAIGWAGSMRKVAVGLFAAKPAAPREPHRLVAPVKEQAPRSGASRTTLPAHYSSVTNWCPAPPRRRPATRRPAEARRPFWRRWLGR